MRITESDRHQIRDQREAERIRIRWERLPLITEAERLNLLDAERSYPTIKPEVSK